MHNVNFTGIDRVPRGSLARLLRESYAILLASGGSVWQREAVGWEQFDAEAYTRPEVARCVFPTWSGDDLVGFGSYDPRGAPRRVLVGHHCIVPPLRRRGLGRVQFRELLRRLDGYRYEEVGVTTLSSPFFEAAAGLYTSFGFEYLGRSPWVADPSVDELSFTKRRGSGVQDATPVLAPNAEQRYRPARTS